MTLAVSKRFAAKTHSRHRFLAFAAPRRGYFRYHIALRVDAVNLEYVFGDIQSNRGDLHVGGSLV